MNLKTNPELLPLIEWWEKDGKQTVIYLVLAVVVVGGYYGVKAHRASLKAAASEALVNAYTTEEIEEAATKFAKSDTAGALKLRLAKSYFDAGRYEEALAQYEEQIGKAPEGFEDVPVVGKAQALEALGKFAEAQKAFEEFVAANPKSYLKLTAQLGAARSQAQAGKKDEALKAIEALKAEVKDEPIAKMRVESTETAIKRLGKKAPAKVEEPKKAKVEEAKAKAEEPKKAK